jgi:hypothetical protein
MLGAGLWSGVGQTATLSASTLVNHSTSFATHDTNAISLLASRRVTGITIRFCPTRPVQVSEGTNAEAYRRWIPARLPDGIAGWAQAATLATHDTNADGRPSSVQFAFLRSVVVDGSEHCRGIRRSGTGVGQSRSRGSCSLTAINKPLGG